MIDPMMLAYGAPLAMLWAGYAGLGKLRERRALAARKEAEDAGLTEPASLHPVIDPNFCIGCGSCVGACPEGRILGLVGGKAQLIEPSRCIGHGACARACPMEAIQLVFGTATRGVDIPQVDEDFQTNVPGIYIAGELGGMGLIRNAIEQGRQAMASIIAARGRPAPAGMHDVIIVGAGPAGISASLAAKEAGLDFLTLEQDSLGGTVAHFPRGKLVMTAPAHLPIYGKVNFRETSKEALLELWQKVVAETGLQINHGQRVDGIERMPDGSFEVITPKGRHRGRAVLLAIGRRGTPRKLGVPGEELSKVVYRLIDPEQYAGKAVLVVGGGDSALEAATSIAEQAGTDVTISYRSGSFSRAKPANRERIAAADSTGKLRVLMNSNVKSIGEDHVVIDAAGEEVRLANDAVIICAGGILPTGFLKAAGIHVETRYGTAA